MAKVFSTNYFTRINRNLKIYKTEEPEFYKHIKDILIVI